MKRHSSSNKHHKAGIYRPKKQQIKRKKGAPKAKLSLAFRRAAADFLARGRAPLSIALIYNPTSEAALKRYGTHDNHISDDPFVAHDAQALRALGHTVKCIPISYGNIEQIQGIKADFVMNFCEGTSLDGDPGVEVLAALERRVVPFSGVGSAPYHLSNDKWAMKAALVAAGVPVPHGAVMGHGALAMPSSLKFPLFVKPRYGFGSLEISSKSHVTDEKSLRAAVARVVKNTGADAIIEEYIDGRELSVGVLGNENRVVVMPPIEIKFGKSYGNIPRVRTYDTKNNTKSPLYWDFSVECPADLPRGMRAKVEETAKRAYLAIGGDGFGRVDIRLSKDGTPHVLEANGNCSLEESPAVSDCGIFVLISRAIGWSYPETLARLIGAGFYRPLRRYRMPMLSMRRLNGKISVHSTSSIRKGAIVCPVGALLPAPSGTPKDQIVVDSGKNKLFAEPHVRFLSHSDNPNLFVQRSRNKFWLVTGRSIRTGEEFTLDRRIASMPEAALVEANPPEFAAALMPISQRRIR